MPRTIELRSGTWEWSVREGEDGARRPHGLLSRTLVLHDPDNPANRMVVRVPPHLGGPGDEAVVAAAAAHPERRFVADEEGEVWTIWPVRHDPDEADAMAPEVVPSREVRVSRVGERGGATVLPAGCALGQLTAEELLDIIR